MRLHAYVLAGDPAWAAESLSSYYHLVDSVVVSFDATNRSWSGNPLMVDDAVAALRSADPDHKIRWLPGAYSFPERPPWELETEQRQAALVAASDGCDWVLQLDTDEIVLSPSALTSHLERADRRGAAGLDFPLRDFYQTAGSGRFLEHCDRFWRAQAAYPGPVGVRSGTVLSNCRQAAVPLYRVDLRSRNTDPAHSRDARVHAVVPPAEAVAHLSWVRTEAQMEWKSTTIGYAKARNWEHDLHAWRWRGRHPWLATVGTPVTRNPLDRYRVSRLAVFDRTRTPDGLAR